MRANVFSLSLCVCALSLCTARVTHAEGLELPAPSPKARVEQRVGLTDFSVDYSSPAVKGRVIWGAVVPYDKPWRSGANASTTLQVSKDFSFGGKQLPAGSYALYTVPSKSAWKVALSSKTDTQGNDYDAKYDVASLSVKPTATTTSRERLVYLFDNTSDAGTQLTLEWEKVQLAIPLSVDTKGQVNAGLQKSVDEAWRPHFTAARYLLDNGGDLEQALRYVDQSIAIKATWWNHWVRAQVLQKKGRAQDAVTSAEKALQLGQGDRMFESFFKPDITKAAKEWKK